MKNTKLAITILAITLLFLGGWYFGNINSRNTQQVQAQYKQGEVDTKALESLLNLTFVPANMKARDAKMSMGDAVTRATKTQKRLQDATGVTAELGYLYSSNLANMANDGKKVDQNLAANQLVWIVSFQGIETVSSGPPGSNHHTAHEYNVVIDAATGEFVMGFVYR